MPYKVITLKNLREARRKQTIDVQVPYVYGGELRYVPKKIVNGEMDVFELAKPIGEMITTPDGLNEVIQNTVINLELGREAMPLLYQSIYRRLEDANFTENVDIWPFIHAQVVFLQHMELEEVKFGTRKIGPKETVPILTYAAGFEYTEDMVLYDKTWERAELDRAMGEAHNALLNHIHFNPIIDFTYAAKNKTGAQTEGEGDSRVLNIRKTIRKGLIDAHKDKNAETLRRRKPSVLLAHESNRWDIEEALQRHQVSGTIYPALSGINTLIFYDGYEMTVGEKTYEYAGVDEGKAYLIEPQRYYRELIKHDLRVDATRGDLTRLVEQQVVGRARRGVIAAPANSVQELTLPS